MSERIIMHELFPEGIYVIPEPDRSAGQPTALHSPEKKEEKPAEEIAPVAFRGKNRQKTLVLYQEEGPLPDAQEEFLIKVLKAVGLDLADIALVSRGEYPERWVEIPAQKILFFGGAKTEETENSLYQPHKKDAAVLMYCDPLEVIMKDRSLKAALWNGLQEMFGLSKG